MLHFPFNQCELAAEKKKSVLPIFNITLSMRTFLLPTKKLVGNLGSQETPSVLTFLIATQRCLAAKCNDLFHEYCLAKLLRVRGFLFEKKTVVFHVAAIFNVDCGIKMRSRSR